MPVPFSETLALHGGVYSPLVFAGLLWAGWKAAVQARHEATVLLVAVFSLPIVVFYLLLSFKEAGEPNWTAPGFVALGPWLAASFRQIPWTARPKAALRASALGLGILLCAAGLPTSTFSAKPVPPSPTPATRSSASRAGRRPRWRPTGLSARRRRARGGRCSWWRTAINWRRPWPMRCRPDSPLIRPPGGYPRVHMLESPNISNQFSFWPRYDGIGRTRSPASPYLGQDALFLTEDSADNSAPTDGFLSTFARVEPTALVEIRRLGLPVRRVKIFACSGYRGLDW